MPRAPSLLDGAAAPRHPPRVRYLLLLVLFLTACSTSPASISIDVTAGQETTAFADAGVTAITVSVTSLDGTIHETSPKVSPDGGTFDFGNIASSEQICVAASGYDASGDVVMSGQTLTGLLLSSIPSDIPVFIQQTEQWARPTGGLSSSHVGGVATVVGENLLILTGGKAATKDTTSNPSGVDTYDLFALGGDATGPAFNPLPRTMVPLLPASTGSDVQILLINDAASAIWLDYSNTGATPLPPPSLPVGLSSYGDVAGGAVVNGAGGAVFVVGAARTSSASKAILEVDSTTMLGAYTLTTARKGAATAWVSGLGLVVAGGSTTGAGVEVPVADGATPVHVGAYPPDGTVGAGAVADGTNTSGFYLVGGTLNGSPQDTRHFSPCTSSCPATPVPWAKIPVALQNVTAYQLAVATPCSTKTPASIGRILVVGEATAGTGTLSFLVDLDKQTVTAVPLREPRRGATALPAPNGTLALVGGEHLDGTPALSIELFAP